VAEERKVPYVVVTGAADDITQQKYKYVYRICPSNAYYAVGLMSFLNDVVKPKSVAILYESSDFGTSGADDMEKQAAKAGMKVLLKEKYEKGAVDFKPILSKVKAANLTSSMVRSWMRPCSCARSELRIDAKLLPAARGFDTRVRGQRQEAAEYVVTATGAPGWDYPALGFPEVQGQARRLSVLPRGRPTP
jgi:branched-chain amino acid transport system substrate-binding protein